MVNHVSLNLEEVLVGFLELSFALGELLVNLNALFEVHFGVLFEDLDDASDSLNFIKA